MFEDKRRRFVEVFTEFMVMISTILLQQFLRQDLEDKAKEVLSNMFFAVIAMIVLVNLAYLVSTLYEQWWDYKVDKARQKRVEEHGVHSLMKFIDQRFKTGQRPKSDDKTDKDNQLTRFRIINCSYRIHSRGSCGCSCGGRILRKSHHFNLRNRSRALSDVRVTNYRRYLRCIRKNGRTIVYKVNKVIKSEKESVNSSSESSESSSDSSSCSEDLNKSNDIVSNMADDN